MPSPATHRPTVAIIGAGWAGLACALRLAESGYQPVLFESAPEPGGRARRAKVADHWRDNGQHLMLAGCRALRHLFATLGLKLPQVPFHYVDGKRQLKLGHPGAFQLIQLLRALWQASGFTLGERWALIRALQSLHLRRWIVPQEQTVLDWLQVHNQPAALIAHFWVPLALAILNTHPEEAAMQRLAAVLRDTLGSGADALSILQPEGNFSDSIVTPWVSAIRSAGGQLHCSQRVTRIEPVANAYNVVLQGEVAPRIFDQVVLAVAPWSLVHLQLPFDVVNLVARFGHQPIGTVYLGFDPAVRLPAPLMQLAGPTAADARIWAMDRAHCSEPGVIAIALSADGPWTALDHTTLAQRCLDQLRKTGLHAPCNWQRVVVVQKATPAAGLNARLLPAEATPLPGFWLTGDWTHPVYPATLEAAVDSGWQTAGKIMSGQH